MITLIKEVVEYLLEKNDEGSHNDAELIDIIRLYLLPALCKTDKQHAADMIIDIVRTLGYNPVIKPSPYSLYGCLAWAYNDDNKEEVDRVIQSMKGVCAPCIANEDDFRRHCVGQSEYNTALSKFVSL